MTTWPTTNQPNNSTITSTCYLINPLAVGSACCRCDPAGITLTKSATYSHSVSPVGVDTFSVVTLYESSLSAPNLCRSAERITMSNVVLGSVAVALIRTMSPHGHIYCVCWDIGLCVSVTNKHVKSRQKFLSATTAEIRRNHVFLRIKLFLFLNLEFEIQSHVSKTCSDTKSVNPFRPEVKIPKLWRCPFVMMTT